MNILAVADIHGAQYRINLIVDACKKYNPDLVVICGDITQFGPGEAATNLLNQIPQHTLAITGNIDTIDVEAGIDKSQATNINKKRIQKDNLSFIGLGGNSISPNQIIAVDTEKKNLTDIIDDKTILVTHVPPYKIQDSPYLGFHIGSKELRTLIDTYHPALVLCGHVHEDPGYTIHNDTVVVNCSMGKKGSGALISLTDTITVTMLD